MRIKDVTAYVREWYEKNLYLKYALCFYGGVGVGKSQSVKKAAEDMGIGFIDLRFSQIDSIDMRGIPSTEAGRTRFNPSDLLPLEGYDDYPERGILFLDEITLGDRLTRASGYQVVNERCLGKHKIKPGWAILGATNRAQDKCDIDELPAALRNRFQQIWVDSSVEDYAAYVGNEDDLTVRYLKANPKDLFGSVENEAFATPRTWERVSQTVQALGPEHPHLQELVSGLVGGSADSFIKFVKSGGTTHATIYRDILEGKRVAGLKLEDIEPVYKNLNGSKNVGYIEKLVTFALTTMGANKEKLRKVRQALNEVGAFTVLQEMAQARQPITPSLIAAVKQLRTVTNEADTLEPATASGGGA